MYNIFLFEMHWHTLNASICCRDGQLGFLVGRFPSSDQSESVVAIEAHIQSERASSFQRA